MLQNFEKSQIFEANPDSILALINNFEAYQEFLPGCLESKRLVEDLPGASRGKLVFGFLNQILEFESMNQTNGHHVEITQVKGPFSQFSASWTLESVDLDRTSVKFKTNFYVPFFLKFFARQGFIDKMGEKFLNAFAEQLLK